MGMNEVLATLHACCAELDSLDSTSFEAAESLGEAFGRVMAELDEADITAWAPQWRQAMEDFLALRNFELAHLRADMTHRVNCLNAFLRDPS